MKEFLAWLNNINQIFWKRIVNNTMVDTNSLAVFRIFTGLYMFCFGFPYFLWIGELPQIFFDPPFLSINNLFTDFPNTVFFLISNFLLLILIVFITFGIKAKISSILYIIILAITAGFNFSLGKIDHAFHFYLILLFCMSFSDWGTKLAIWPDKKIKVKNDNRALSLLAILICFGFFTAGFEKAIAWINFDFTSNGSGAWYYKSFQTRSYLLAPYIPKFLPFWGFKIMDFIAVVFELSPLLFLLHSRSTWRIWLMTACIFHLCNTLIFNINFIYVCIVYLAFINYSPLYKTVYNLFKHKLFWFICFVVLIIALFYRFDRLLSKVPSTNIFFPQEFILENLYFSILLSFLVLMIFVWDWFRSKEVK